MAKTPRSKRRALWRQYWRHVLTGAVVVLFLALQAFLFHVHTSTTMLITSTQSNGRVMPLQPHITSTSTSTSTHDKRGRKGYGRVQWPTPMGSGKINRSEGPGSAQWSKPMLLVGGSDGSGTRAFVQTLRELGTTIISEDKYSFDVHANEIGGWPELIEEIYIPFGRDGFFSSNPSGSSLSSNGNGSRTLSTATGSGMESDAGRSLLVDNYDWPPKEYKNRRLQERVENKIQKLLNSWNFKFYRLQRVNSNKAATRGNKGPGRGRPDHRGGSATVFPNAVANGVRFAVKAPVSMLALPAFAARYFSHEVDEQVIGSPSPPPLKFLHVIRDGRDVALSDNQSPVIKFYNLTYPKQLREAEPHRSRFSAPPLVPPTKQNEQMFAKAMQLWNDWNVAVYRWATNGHRNRNDAMGLHQGNDHLPLVEYLWVRSEDLLVSGSQERLDALTAMAKFVGSTLTPEELCCLTMQQNKDHGASNKWESASSRRDLRRGRGGYRGPLKSIYAENPKPQLLHNKSKEGGLEKRYGKWQKILANNSQLYNFFHKEGAEGLQLFGYHPYRQMYRTSQNATIDEQEKHDGRSTDESSKKVNAKKEREKRRFGDEESMDTPICSVSINCTLKK